MQTFPVTDSTISGKYLGSYIQEKYNLTGEVNCRIFRTGINDSYIVSNGKLRFVFRIYCFNWRSEKEIKEEIRFLNLLKENNISVSYPIPDSDENYIQKIPAPEGPRYGMLFSFAEGEKVRFITEDTSYQIGSLMANLHKISKNITLNRINYTTQSLVLDPYDSALVHFSENNEEMKFIRKAGEVVSTVFEEANKESLRSGAIHLDIWYDNMHIKSESEMTIFDFDFCGNGWFLHDIAYFSHQLYHIEPDKKVYESKLKAFFNGYESVSKISKEEKRLIPYSGLSTWIFYLGIQSQRFDNWSNVFLSENYLSRFMGMAKGWLKYHGIKIEY